MRGDQDPESANQQDRPSASPKDERTTLALAASNSNAALRRTIRRPELHRMVPLADTTIYDMERRGEFPRRFNLTPRCVVWDAAEVEAWLESRREASNSAQLKRAPSPDVRKRKRRPVRATPGS
ncbi:helix-turn-helix transcriptional regulator [Pelomonas sp. BJYL3]|uniref:helix-turn-helix transcriptional regulator n=1 Tax=Pelomonas sp. BJYL3 TaxID=2976697 RepID=UPI0022B360BA|nr:AlpA family phage regulatory protein [Pelomonas sp. BJYL3]